MDIENILKRGREATEKAVDLRALDDVRVAYLGKKANSPACLKAWDRLMQMSDLK